ncbi:MAG: hypothetical protein GXC73_19815, partial [Chitinophagaceae bacterium]|nr:hypothetical protein [Chitinophagaceae bacterium]
TNLLNPLHIDLFDFRVVGFVTDEQFGKQSKNLVKSAKMKTPAGQVFIAVDLAYTTDVDGYMKTITLNATGQPVTTYTCTFQ